MRHPPNESQPAWIIAHRGANSEVPENTRAAFDAALAHRIDGIECDVQMSKDGVLVLYHNNLLPVRRGKKMRVSDFAFQEFLNCDRRVWFPENKTYAGECLFTLDELLKSYCQRTRLLIEIKSYIKDRRSGTARALTVRVLEVLRERVPRKFRDNIFILSFDPEVLNLVHGEAPHWKTVLNIKKPLSMFRRRSSDLDYLYGFCLPISTLTKRFIRYAEKKNQIVMTYSCNTPEQMEKARKLNAHVVMTDNPGWLVDYLTTRGLR